MTPWYLAPRRASRATNLAASSTSQRTGRPSSPEATAFSRAHATLVLDALEASVPLSKIYEDTDVAAA